MSFVYLLPYNDNFLVKNIQNGSILEFDNQVINEINDNINREIEIDYDNCKHPGDSTTISEI